MDGSDKAASVSEPDATEALPAPTAIATLRAMPKPPRPDRGGVAARIARRIACHQQLHDPAREPRNRGRWLPEVRRWQAQRLGRSFARFLDDPTRAPAARFFLSDVYGDHDFSRRDADLVRVMPMMQRLLPAALLETVVEGISTNVPLHCELMVDASFVAGGTNIHYLEEWLAQRKR